MNVGELKKLIEDLPDDMEVILQKDSEENGYAPLYDGDPDSIYVANSPNSGEIYVFDWGADGAGMTEVEWQKLVDGPRWLVLYPVS